MAITVDGKTHKSKIELKYGDKFPTLNRNFEVVHERYGLCRIYVFSMGTPQWTEKMSVSVQMEYIITEILDPSKTYVKEQKVKKIGLRRVK